MHYQPTTTQQLVWYEGGQTKAYENHLMRLLVGSTIQEVSVKENIS